MSRFTMITGSQVAVTGNVHEIAGKEKQFCAVLLGADPGDSAVVEVRVTPNGNNAKSLVVATLTVTEAEPVDVTPIIESLMGQFFAKVVSIDSGEVYVYGEA